MITFPAEAPIIESFSWTESTGADISDTDTLESSNVVWNEFSDGQTFDNDTKIIRVVAKAKSMMDPTSWAGNGIQLGIDEIPSWFTGYLPDNFDWNYDSATQYFTADAYFAIPNGFQISGGNHALTTVIYEPRQRPHPKVGSTGGTCKRGAAY